MKLSIKPELDAEARAALQDELEDYALELDLFEQFELPVFLFEIENVEGFDVPTFLQAVHFESLYGDRGRPGKQGWTPIEILRSLYQWSHSAYAIQHLTGNFRPWKNGYEEFDDWAKRMNNMEDDA